MTVLVLEIGVVLRRDIARHLAHNFLCMQGQYLYFLSVIHICTAFAHLLRHKETIALSPKIMPCLSITIDRNSVDEVGIEPTTSRTFVLWSVRNEHYTPKPFARITENMS